MKRSNLRWTAALLAVGVFTLSVTLLTQVRAQASTVDPAAIQTLKG